MKQKIIKKWAKILKVRLCLILQYKDLERVKYTQIEKVYYQNIIENFYSYMN